MSNKLTDNDIIMALEVLDSWQQVALQNDDGTDKESPKLYEAIQIVKDTINRLQAENERLKKGWKADVILTADAKTEAYKEFAERFYEELRMYGIKDKFNKSVFLNVVDKAKKELVGEDNG